MARTSDAKDRLTDAVIELIWTGSYGSTSVDLICERAGVKKGSFYHFFESKTALALAGIEKAWAFHRGEMDRLFSAVHPPIERLRNWTRSMIEEQVTMKKKHGRVLGCPIHSLGAEVSTLDDSLRDKLQGILSQFIRYFETAIRDAHALEEIDAPDAPFKARIVFAYSEGLLAHARIWNDLHQLDELESGVMSILGVKTTRKRARS